MELSRLLLNTTSLTLETIFRATDTDIRVHDVENIPADQPVLFVVNHFTRLETLLVPYLLNKHTKRYTLSLASHTFFGGNFGKIMQKVGAVSTKDPERDQLFLSNLLTGRLHTVIFPEGQMIKDKKIIEKGKFMVYNTGLRRPPHTGAAGLALRAQFYRQKIEYFLERGYETELLNYKEYFRLTDDEIEAIPQKETYIVPINITYYPIRAKNNSIKRLVERFTKNMSDRFEEELEVEGTMLMEGVDIDLNFGPPIPARKYLDRSRKARKLVSDPRLFLEGEELKKELPMRKESIDYMQEYMGSIYGMTTVNHDHIFASVLASYRKSVIDENDFKNRANLIINRVKDLRLPNFHTTLNKKQPTLQTDEFNAKYASFMEAALSDNLILLRNGSIIRNRKKFSLPLQFHSVRKDNIVEVLKNEIEPLEELIRLIRRTMLIPGWWVRRQVRNRFLQMDLELFESDYERYAIEGESKPREIGKPYFLKRFWHTKGVLLVHGYMAAPEETRPLGDYLFRNGYTVYGVRLRGHGTAPEDLAEKHWEEWYDSVNRGYVVMKNSVRKFAIVGFSMGAGLSLLQAANKGNKIKGVVSINAPFRLQDIKSHLSTAIVYWNKLVKKINMKSAQMEFVKNSPENPTINYFRNPVSGVHQLGQMIGIAEERLGDVTVPALIIQGSNDPVVNPDSGKAIFEKLGTHHKEYFIVESKRHGILRGAESKIVFRKVVDFLREVMG